MAQPGPARTRTLLRHLHAQFTVLLLLLGAFRWVAGTQIGALLRREVTARHHAPGIAGLAALLAILTGLATLTGLAAIAMLGDTHVTSALRWTHLHRDLPAHHRRVPADGLTAAGAVAAAANTEGHRSAPRVMALSTKMLLAWYAY